MASSLLALLDDITTVLDDIALLTKVAAKKTAGVLGDDLALNAQQVAGVHSNRELPVVWAVTKGSLRNKAILVPGALLISAFAPWAVSPLLMTGGMFLCFEGTEKLVHKSPHARRTLPDPNADLLQLERDKVKGAIRTDFVLSAEIIAITLGTVVDTSMPSRIGVLVSIALIMTAGVYGLVAAIVKLDDLGLHLQARNNGIARAIGRAIVTAAPWLMKLLSVAGTVAMFLVGGGIIVHGLPVLRHAGDALSSRIGRFHGLTPLVFDAVVGLAAGATVVGVVAFIKHVWPRRRLPKRI
jgi:predicted DNA repair protein MutK